MLNEKRYYQCTVCGSVVLSMRSGQGTFQCCNQPMKQLPALSNDEGNEKHVPVLEETAEGIRVTIGEIPHPMDEEHYIAWIEVLTTDEKSYWKFLQPHEKPQATFPVKKEAVAMVREYCTKHGLWKA